MHDYFILLVVVVILALIFDYINGFHDTANSIATVVSTRVLRPVQAITMAAVLNLIGAFIGIEVAKTIGVGIVDLAAISQITVISALISGIFWNLLTWYFGIPSSSSHAIIGGLCGAAFGYGGMNVIKMDGLWNKVFLPMFSSPIIGISLGFTFMILLYNLLIKVRPSTVNRVFSKLQLVSAGFMAMSHGQNDAQKTMGVITLAIISYTVFSVGSITDKMDNKISSTSTSTGITTISKADKKTVILAFINQGGFIVKDKNGIYHAYTGKNKEGHSSHSTKIADFHLTEVTSIDNNTVKELHKALAHKELTNGEAFKVEFSVPFWVVFSCAMAMGLGTLSGGWKIINTMGSKMIKLRPVHGFAAETSAALMIQAASHFGMPVSTTHIISTSIMGVGAAKRVSAVKWKVVGNIVVAWIFTFPVTFIIGALCYKILALIF